MSLIKSAPAASARAATSALYVSMEIGVATVPANSSTHRHDAGRLLFRVDGQRTGPCRFAADIDDVRAFRPFPARGRPPRLSR